MISKKIVNIFVAILACLIFTVTTPNHAQAYYGMGGLYGMYGMGGLGMMGGLYGMYGMGGLGMMGLLSSLTNTSAPAPTAPAVTAPAVTITPTVVAPATAINGNGVVATTTANIAAALGLIPFSPIP